MRDEGAMTMEELGKLKIETEIAALKLAKSIFETNVTIKNPQLLEIATGLMRIIYQK